MNTIFKGLIRHSVLVFFDDILVYSKTMAEHCNHFAQVLSVLHSNSLFVNLKKCCFAKTRLDYLGHIISGEGVLADPDKVAAMDAWPLPTSPKDLRGFLGLTGYYRRFVRDYGKIAAPLTQLLRKDSFQWTEEATFAFNQLKQAMKSVPILSLPDFSAVFILETDASGFGVGAVLSQGERPIAFFSQALSPRARAKSAYERELMAIVLAIHKWRHYLLGRQFVVHTDQRSLKYLLEQRMVSPEYQRWLVKLLGYHFDIQYKPGTSNVVADALSRYPVTTELQVLSIPSVVDETILVAKTLKDPFLMSIRTALMEDSTSRPGWCLRHDRLFFHSKLAISRSSSLKPKILFEFHSRPIGGHGGVLKTFKRISAEFYWVGMRSDIREYVTSCSICQANKYEKLAPDGLLQPLPIPTAIWDDISLDFIEGLPTSQGYNSILVVVDRLSKYGHFFPLKHPFSAKTVADVFLRGVVRPHGFPRSIVSDRDKVFLSHFWSELFRLHHTKLNRSTAYHPQSDGQTKVVNRCLETYLRCFVHQRPKQWSLWVHWAEYWYNTSFHSSLQCTPFKVVYGRDPPPLFQHGISSSSTHSDLADLLSSRDQALRELRDQLLLAQNRMKQQADKGRREVNFQIGDLVYLKLRPYRQMTVARRTNMKLSPRFYGPFPIVAKVGSVAYRLDLPPTASIHPVFHVSQLKRTVGTPPISSSLPALLPETLVFPLEPEAVIAYRSFSAGPEVLIKWVSLPVSDASWELVRHVRKSFPAFHLEDKVASQDGCNDRATKPATVKRGHSGGKEGVVGDELGEV
ncbi:hypothetical protein Sjap_002893 [Stephania japonica]|uniref:Uncharacterized protein n=1 Tax=Stephania japonica TaxID=461633 RepID=A0AAP0KMQ7_9MAGN